MAKRLLYLIQEISMKYEKQEIVERVQHVIARQLKKNKADIVLSATLDSLGVDSLDRVELVMECEEQFGIEIDDTAAESLQTVQQVVEYIYQHQK